jgi:hypothetical protein
LNDGDKVANLINSVSGQAGHVLWDDGDPSHDTYDQLASRLLKRFGCKGQGETFQTKLRVLPRRRDETLQVVYQDVKRLMALAYPGERSRCKELMTRDAFLFALDDRQLEQKTTREGTSRLGRCLCSSTQILVVQQGDGTFG